jgi:hypothetical protein
MVTQLLTMRSDAPISSDGRHQPHKLYLRFPSEIWNDYNSLPAPKPKRAVPNFRTTATSKTNVIKAKHNHKSNKMAVLQNRKLNFSVPSTLPPKVSPTHTIKCKTKIWRFHPGGPNHAVSGKSMNEMVLKQPCLQPKCTDCIQTYPNLLVGVPLSPLQTIYPKLEQPTTKALSPLEAMPQEHAQQTTAETTSLQSPSPLQLPPPVIQSSPYTAVPLANIDPIPLQTTTQPQYDILLPKSLIQRAIPVPVGAKTKWRSVPRKQYIARLKFITGLARRRFAEVMGTELKSVGKGDLKSCVKRRFEGGEEEERGVEAGRADGSVRKKVRFRHRVRLVFRSEEGRGRFGDIVGKSVGWSGVRI